jgi:hypothetical protein
MLVKFGLSEADMKKILVVTILTSIFFVPLAYAAVDPASDLGGYAQELLKAAQTSNWRLVAGLLLVGTVWGLRLLSAKWPFKFGKAIATFLGTARGGAVLSLACGVLGGVGNVLLADGSMTPRLFVDGIVMALTASGFWTITNKLLKA